MKKKDYREFLDAYPRWRLVHEGEAYNKNEIRAREDALMSVLAKVISAKSVIKTEVRDKEYRHGFNRAISDITAAIDQELKKKTPIDSKVFESREDTMAYINEQYSKKKTKE